MPELHARAQKNSETCQNYMQEHKKILKHTRITRKSTKKILNMPELHARAQKKSETHQNYMHEQNKILKHTRIALKYRIKFLQTTVHDAQCLYLNLQVHY